MSSTLEDLATETLIKPVEKNASTEEGIDINSMGDGVDREQLDVSAAPKKPPTMQKCVFTANATRVPFNVTAQPFVLNPKHRNYASTSTPIKERVIPSSYMSSPMMTRMCPPIPHITPIPHNGPKGVDGRIWRSISAHHIPIYSYEDEVNRIHTSHSQYSVPYSMRRNARDDNARLCGPLALPNGTIQVRLREGICVDMTLDKSVRVTNRKSRIAISMASTASSAAMIHPNGKVYQYGSRVEIVAYDGMQNNNYVRYAKMWYKGVSFTSENCALIYLVDTAGTRTTTDSFTDMSKDYTISVFLNDSRHGSVYAEEAMATLQNSTFWCGDDGTEVYDINGFRICQTLDGLVKVTRPNNKCLIRTSPGNGSATLTTPFMHCTASLGQTSHLFLRRGERRMHFDGSSFVVRNAGHSAGFDDHNLLKVY